MSEKSVEEVAEQSDASYEESNSSLITVVLTADNHLGYTAPDQQPRKREELQQRLCRAFQQATDFAIGQGVDLFIQAGDLFDTPTPDERDRSFVAARLAQLKQAGIRAFAVGGLHDTPDNSHSLPGERGERRENGGHEIQEGRGLAPHISYAQLGALHYFTPVASVETELEPVLIDVRGVSIALCGMSIAVGQRGDLLAHIKVQSKIERATIALLILHAPVEGMTGNTPADLAPFDLHPHVSRGSILHQSIFRTILTGYDHAYTHQRIGACDVIVAGATQHIDFSNPTTEPGFVFLGLDASGLRWCKHIAVDALAMKRLVISTDALWLTASDGNGNSPGQSATDTILEQLRPLCSDDAMVQLRFEGKMDRSQYHQLDLNRIRRYGEEHCFALAIDDSGLTLMSEEEITSLEMRERLSPREEIVAVADEWIAAANDEEEKKALRATKEAVLMAMDAIK